LPQYQRYIRPKIVQRKDYYYVYDGPHGFLLKKKCPIINLSRCPGVGWADIVVKHKFKSLLHHKKRSLNGFANYINRKSFLLKRSILKVVFPN